MGRSQVRRQQQSSLGRSLIASMFLGLFALSVVGAKARAEDLVLDFLYGSEKEKWITKATETYNNAGHAVKGRKVVIKPIATGSGEAMDALVSGRSKAQLFSPASGLFIELGNSRAKRNPKDGKPLVGDTRTLVLSPVVIAMWEPMAKALGWPEKRIGWSDVLKLATDKEGWASVGHPEFGQFKFGHTHPYHSNSGLISVLAEACAGAGVAPGEILTKEQLGLPATAEFVRGIESSMVYYGKSTGFFADEMFATGPQFLSASVLYESSVIESYDRVKHPPSGEYQKEKFPVVAIYPSDGTFWSDHPIGIVDRNVKGPEESQAAREYIDFLLAKPQQMLAMETGFRPGDDGIALAAPLDKAHGVDPEVDIPVRPIPTSDVMDSVLDLWRQNKRRPHVTIILDRSQSMLADQKMVFAKLGIAEAVNRLGDDDRLSILLFNDRVNPLIKDGEVREVRAKALAAIPNILAAGQTALYDVLKVALDDLEQNGRGDLINAIVLLSDGQDTSSKNAKIDDILNRLRNNNERSSVRVFTIYYGKDASKKEMELIAKTSRAKSFEGTPENIRKVIDEISIFYADK